MSYLRSWTSQGNVQLNNPLLRCQIQLTLQVGELIEVMRRQKDQDSRMGPDIVLRRNNFQSSTKLDALVHDLSMHHITLLLRLLNTWYRGYSQQRSMLQGGCLLAVHKFHRSD